MNYDIITLGVSGTVGLVAVAQVRVRAQRQRWQGRERFELRFPPDVGPEAVAHVLVDLLPAPGPLWFFDGFDLIALEIVATESGIRHFITLRQSRIEASRSALFAAIPGLRLEATGLDLPQIPTSAVEIGTSSLDRPLRSDNPAATSRSVLASLAPLRHTEIVRIQWIVAKAGSRRPIPDPAPRPGKDQHLLAGLATEDPVIGGYWSSFEAMSDGERAQVTAHEFQIAATGVTDLAEVLALGRGYNVGFTLANQSPTQPATPPPRES